MGTIAGMIVAGARRSRGWGDKLLAGVTKENYARKPHLHRDGSPFVIECNHPAFILGHLGLYPSKVAQVLGLEAAPFMAPAGFEDLFKNGAPCRDDPAGTIYPKLEAITAQYTVPYDAIIERVSTLEDGAFSAPIPDAFERFRANFPSAGGVAMFLLNNHQMMHLGQLSTWRRCMGLGPA